MSKRKTGSDGTDSDKNGKPKSKKVKAPKSSAIIDSDDSNDSSDESLYEKDESESEVTTSSSSDEEAEVPASKQKKAAQEKGKATLTRRGRKPASKNKDPDPSMSDSEEGELSEESGLYENEEDKERLRNMTEKEREEEIYRRLEAQEMRKTRMEIEKRLKKRKDLQSKKSQSSPSESDNSDSEDLPKTEKIGKSKVSKEAKEIICKADDRKTTEEKAKDTKAKAMENLKAAREQKKNLVAEAAEKKKLLQVEDVYGDDSSSSSSSRSESSADSESESEKSEEEEDSPLKKEIETKDDLLKITFKRQQLEHFVYAPFFADLVRKCFVRVGIGAGNADGTQVYRVAEIMDIVETPKIYEAGSHRTNKGLKLKHGGDASRVFRLPFMSNSRITDSEFEKWKRECKAKGLSLPTHEFVLKKQSEISKAYKYQFSSDEIEQMVKEKNKFKKTPNNFAIRKTELMKEKELAMQHNDEEEMARVEAEMEELETAASKLERERSKKLDIPKNINERNRQRNLTYMQSKPKTAEVRGDGRIAVEADDPFSRKKSKPTLVTKAKSGERKIISVDRSRWRNSPKLEDTGANRGKDSDQENSIGTQETANGAAPLRAKEEETPMQGEIVNNILEGESALTTPVSGAVVPQAFSSPRKAVSSMGLEPLPEDSGDLFNAHDFDVHIDLGASPTHLPPTSTGIPKLLSEPQSESFSSRKQLNLDDYKKRKGLI